MAPQLMKCHYEVLEVGRDVDEVALKKQYRKMALKYHPDKNPDDPEGAKQTFQVIQQAYDVLSDPQEKAWYDNHREAILRGGLGEKMEDDGIDLFQYFSSSCYSGFGDDEDGFYGVYSEVFKTLAKEDLDFMDEQDSDYEIPEFGKSSDDYEEVCAAFYSFWSGYSTPRSYSWLDKYDTRQAENRWMRRKMEQENKVDRDKAKKERNENVRNLVAFVRKRDKRVAAYRKKLEERAEENKQKTKDFQKKQREERNKLFESSKEAAGFGMTAMDEQLRQLEGEYTDSELSDDEDSVELLSDELDEDTTMQLDQLYCVACDKSFKTIGARENHETSKKHRENLNNLIDEMKKEDGDDGEDVEDIDVNEDVEEDDVTDKDSDSDGLISESNSIEAKKNKIKSKSSGFKQTDNADSSEEDCENVFIKPVSDDDDSKDFGKKRGKGKNKKRGKDKESTPTVKITETEVGDDNPEGVEDSVVVIDEAKVEDEGTFKERNLKKSKKNKKKNKGSGNKFRSYDDSSEEGDENEFIKPVSDDDCRDFGMKRGKGKNKKKGKDKEETSVKITKTDEGCEDNMNLEKSENTNTGNAEDILQENESRTAQQNGIIDQNNKDDDDEDIPSKGKKSNKSSKSSKHERLEDAQSDLLRGDLNCAQCKTNFPSKNKLYNHLKSSGHSVYLPKVGGGGEEDTKSKKKKGKK